MFNKLIGDPVRETVKNEIISSVKGLKVRGINPKLAVIRVGEDASQVLFENAIIKASEDCGIETQIIKFHKDVSQAYLEVAVQALNVDQVVHGVIFLSPFPEHIDSEHLRQMLSPSKDVDAITDISLADTFVGKNNSFYACTAEACVELLDYYKVPIEGKKVTIVGRSLTVGKPLAMMLLNRDATVTVCHSKTSREDQIDMCKSADIVILATGQTESFGSEFFKDGQIVIDVGTGEGKDGKIHGDLDVEEIESSGKIKDFTYTPVPGGVGKATTALLLRNIIKAAER